MKKALAFVAYVICAAFIIWIMMSWADVLINSDPTIGREVVLGKINFFNMICN